MLAFIAPGQGAQTPGMLTPWISDPAAKLLLSQWSHEIDLDLVRLGTTADSDEIKDTANAQPLIVAAGLLGARALGSARLAIVAGHSVGEITAAAIAGVIDDVDAMKLVRARGIEMAKAAALKLAQLAPEGARVRALAVAGAFHTSYMQPAVAPLQEIAAKISVHAAKCPVISNKDGAILHDGREILDRIVAQISNPVRWDLCMTTLASHVSGAVEIPPAGTLVGLLKRAVPIIESFALKSAEDVTLAKEFIVRHQDEQNDEDK